MPADSQHENSVKQQALNALEYLGEADKQHILEYIKGLLNLENAKNDQTSAT